MRPIENLIKDKYNSLSPGQKKVAEFLIEQMEEGAFNTAAQLGRKTQVSETTVIRLSYALGFNGFSEMQSFIQKQLFHPSQASEDPVLLSLEDAVETNPFARMIESDIQALSQTFHQLKVQDLCRVIDELIEADQVLIVGLRASHAAAYWFSFMLQTLRGQVHLCPASGEIYERLCDVTDRSVVFVISLPRYSKQTLEIAECAKQKGAKLISLTDRMLSPVGRIADINLTTEEDVESSAPSITPVISVLDLIISGIAKKDHERVQARQQQLEELYSISGIFIE